VDGAARRAARIGDGFFPAAGDLPALFAALRDECEKIGRDPGEIELTAGATLRSLDDVKRMEDLGVSRLIVPPPGFHRDAVEKGLNQLGDAFISKTSWARPSEIPTPAARQPGESCCLPCTGTSSRPSRRCSLRAPAR